MNAVDVLKYSQHAVLPTLDGFPESAWETPGVCGVWSAKDIIGHLASYEHVLVDVLTIFLGGGPTPYLAKFTEPGGRTQGETYERCFGGVQRYARASYVVGGTDSGGKVP